MTNQLERFSPPPFPVRLVYMENGDGIQPLPDTPPVGVRPGAYDKESRYSRSIIEDSRVRGSIQQALLADNEVIQETTKYLAESRESGRLLKIHAVDLAYPNEMPVAVPSWDALGNISGLGNNVNELKGFAFDAYDKLAGHFGDRNWSDWYIAPYFPEGDDTRRVLRLGVFALTLVEE